MTIQEANFNRCCDFLARMIEKYGDSIELQATQNSILICERKKSPEDSQDYIIFVDYSRIA